MSFASLTQARHPERSASTIDRGAQGLWRGVERNDEETMRDDAGQRHRLSNQLSKKIEPWSTIELQQLRSAARMGPRVYEQLYFELRAPPSFLAVSRHCNYFREQRSGFLCGIIEVRTRVSKMLHDLQKRTLYVSFERSRYGYRFDQPVLGSWLSLLLCMSVSIVAKPNQATPCSPCVQQLYCSSPLLVLGTPAFGYPEPIARVGSTGWGNGR